ncbi:hypothetical protein C5167_010104 [Papaver somniferum]|uniref:Uncharacterized protein n=1 Tax=Papaver somniferum TaxID=3469 RepID=A0A4Y7JZA4_PAPSO|nr:hypothetical protein C5167_010104 [Papaver somniferum]
MEISMSDQLVNFLWGHSKGFRGQQ